MVCTADGATVGTAGGAANDGILLGTEAGLLDNTSDGSVKLVHLMVLKVLQCLVSSLVQRMQRQMRVLCLAWSSVQTMEIATSDGTLLGRGTVVVLLGLYS